MLGVSASSGRYLVDMNGLRLPQFSSILPSLGLLLGALTLGACDTDKMGQAMVDKLVKEATGVENMDQAMDSLMRSLDTTGSYDKVVIVDKDQLLGIIPTQLAGLDAAESTSETTSVLGLEMTQATRRYGSDPSSQLTCEITDLGKSSFAIAAMVPFAKLDYERTTDGGGLERTVDVNGHKGLERSSGDGTHELHVYYDGRYLVNLHGKGLELDELHESFAQLDVGSLPRVK